MIINTLDGKILLLKKETHILESEHGQNPQINLEASSLVASI